MLVLDSNVAIRACSASGGFRPFGRERLVAPPLMWSEFRSSLREALWRGEVSLPRARDTLAELDRSRIQERTHRDLGEEAWSIAEELGWVKTYDAEYVALARLLRCRLVTLDARLLRGAARLGVVIGAHEL